MLRFMVVAAIAFLAAQMPSAAQASTVQYDLTLTPTVGNVGGSGYFDVNAPANGSGVYALTAFSVTIDNQLFSLGNELGAATATLTDGALSSLNYVGGLISGLNLDILGTGGLTYAFLDVGTGATLATGMISAVDPPSPTPLPSALVLFATGMLGLLLLNCRRKRVASRSLMRPAGSPQGGGSCFQVLLPSTQEFSGDAVSTLSPK